MPNTFTCLACGAPVEPEPNKERMPCPFCGTALTIPAGLRWKKALEPLIADPPATFDPFRAAQQAVSPAEQAEHLRQTEQVTNLLRKAQPLASLGLRIAALWTIVTAMAPGCLIALFSLCVLACAGSGIIFYFLQRGQ